jgi:hypothetical protein
METIKKVIPWLVFTIAGVAYASTVLFMFALGLVFNDIRPFICTASMVFYACYWSLNWLDKRDERNKWKILRQLEDATSYTIRTYKVTEE